MSRDHTDVAGSIAATVADERLRIVAGLIRLTGDWELAQDCLQDAVERALVRWPRDGPPANPGAWLTTTARRRAVDVLRRRQAESGKLQELGQASEFTDDATDVDPYGSIYQDDRLRLLFTCCHPALPLAGQVALTLKTVTGLSTAEVARAFLVSEATMGQRLLRTRNKITNAGITFCVPEPHRLAERTAGVLAVLYLVFNQGFAVSDDIDHPGGLAAEAIRLTGLLGRLLPGDDEVLGLRALMLLQHSRRNTRVDEMGELIPMPDQDRTRWDSAMITAGLQCLTAARTSGHPAGCYRLQAEIAAAHAAAPDAASTDWSVIVTAYDALLRCQPSPVVALNRCVAIGFRDGPDAGLAALAGLQSDRRLAGYHLLPAVEADLLRRAARSDEATAAYRRALALEPTPAERRFLRRRMAELGQVGAAPVLEVHPAADGRSAAGQRL